MKKRFANFLFMTLVFGMSLSLHSMEDRRDDDLRYWERVAEGWTIDELEYKILKIKERAREDLSPDEGAIRAKELDILKTAFKGLFIVRSDQARRQLERCPSTQGQRVGPA